MHELRTGSFLPCVTAQATLICGISLIFGAYRFPSKGGFNNSFQRPLVSPVFGPSDMDIYMYIYIYIHIYTYTELVLSAHTIQLSVRSLRNSNRGSFVAPLKCSCAIAPTMSTEPLQHLTEQSAGVGAWMLKVIEEPQEENYTWNKSGKSGVGRKLSCVLVSEDHTQYCGGVYKKQGKEPQATQNYKQAVTKYKKGTVWKVSKVSLAKQDPKYLGCSCKVLIDMNTSTFQPVLQSTVKMPNQAAPPHDLATLLQCAGGKS